MKAQGFGQMPKSTRSVAIELHENANAIEAWRATLGGRRYRSDKGNGLFIRCRMSAAGELHLITATANALPI
jgi:hypothetical protein